MNPVAFSIFGLTIRWYGILIAFGMLLGILIADYTCRIRNFNFDSLLNIILLAIPIGIVGARLYYVLFQFDYYKSNLYAILNTRGGGLAIHGGIIFGVLTVIIYTKIKNINFFEAVDVSMPSVILAQSIGRWGNFFNQEAHGGPVSYKFISHFPKFIQNGMNIGGIYYNPTFLYESIWDFACFIVLITMARKTRQKGLVFFNYIGLYSIGRFFIEGMRTDSLMIGPLRMAQLVSLFGIAAWAAAMIYFYYKRKDLKA